MQGLAVDWIYEEIGDSTHGTWRFLLRLGPVQITLYYYAHERINAQAILDHQLIPFFYIKIEILIIHTTIRRLKNAPSAICTFQLSRIGRQMTNSYSPPHKGSKVGQNFNSKERYCVVVKSSKTESYYRLIITVTAKEVTKSNAPNFSRKYVKGLNLTSTFVSNQDKHWFNTCHYKGINIKDNQAILPAKYWGFLWSLFDNKLTKTPPKPRRSKYWWWYWMNKTWAFAGIKESD